MMFCMVGKYAHEHLASCLVEVVEKFNAVTLSGMSSNSVFGSLFGNSQESISCEISTFHDQQQFTHYLVVCCFWEVSGN